MKVIYYVFGGALLRADRSDTEKILNICMHYRFVYHALRHRGEFVYFECTMYTASILLDVCRGHGICVEVVRKYGLPEIIFRYRKRMGVAAGVIIALVLILISNRYLWDIRITGAEIVGYESVLLQLSEQKFSIGSYLPAADIDVIENRVLINSDDIAWISINVNGSVAYVEVREKVPEPGEKNKSPANLIALWDGQIESIAASEGRVMVKPGQHVRRGQLLVSGIADSNVLGFRYTRASGEVLAKTVRTLKVEIPFTYEIKKYSGEEIRQTTVFFFSKEIKLYRNTGFLGGTYDTISKVENFSLFDGTRLPASYLTKTYRYFTNETVRRSNDEAAELAYTELNRQIKEFQDRGAVLLRKNVSWSVTDDSFALECTINLIENIAGISEIIISD